jgi:signal peptidase I
MLMELVQHVSRPMTHRLPETETQTLYLEQLAAVEALARAIPAYRLDISLTGEFWKEIERTLAEVALLQGHSRVNEEFAPSAIAAREVEAQDTTAVPLLDDGALHVVYTGPSMNPTLTEPDLLEVVPYHGQPVQPGDVVYFQPPEGDREVVHRVVALTTAGIQTRGDNSPRNDPYLLQSSDIIGRVVAAHRGRRRRRIAGGQRGVLVGYRSRLWHLVNRGVSRLLHNTYRTLARAGRFGRWLPAKLRPRIFVFRTPNLTYAKLLMAGRVIGQYDALTELWHIRRPFRLFVDEASLPVVTPMDRFAFSQSRLGRSQIEPDRHR